MVQMKQRKVRHENMFRRHKCAKYARTSKTLFSLVSVARAPTSRVEHDLAGARANANRVDWIFHYYCY